MKPTSHNLHRLAAAVLVVGALAACGNQDPQQLVSEARAYIQKNDNAAAIIELKNALQKNPDLVEARFLLGQAMLASGNVVGAETELRKAREASHAPDEVSPLLAQAWLALGQPKKVTEAFDQTQLGSPDAQAALLTSVATAWRMQNRSEEYRKRLGEALTIKPEFAPALVERARLKAGERAFEEALAELDRLLAREPKNADALKLRGDVLQFGLQKRDEALLAYRAAVSAVPQKLDAHVALVRLLLNMDNQQEADKALQVLAAAAPGRPGTLYLQAQQAYQKQDLKLAKERVQQLLKLTPDSPTANEIAGVVELQGGSVVQTLAYLNKALKAEPGLRVARRALVLAHLRAGQLDQAIAALPENLSDAAANADSAMLSVAGRAYMAKGEFEVAQGYFRRASQSDPKDPVKRTSLAVSQFMSGQTDAALNDLSDIAARDAGVVADMALINAHMQRKEFAKALVAIASLEKKKPGDAMPRHLKGLAFMMQGDRGNARKAFEEAQGLDAGYLAAVAGLATLDLSDKQPDAAVQRLEALTKHAPGNPEAWLALADVLQTTNAPPDKVTEAIQQAVKAVPTDSRAQVALVDQHLRNKDSKAALAAAQAAATALPDAPQVMAALGRAQASAGETHQALATFNKLIPLMPRSPAPYLLMANTHLALKDNTAAMQSLSKALDVQPDFLPAQRALAELAVSSQQKDKALSVSRDIQKQRPAQALGFLLEGDIQAAFKQWDAAASAYRAALKKAAIADGAIKLHAVLTAAGKTADADRWVAEWTKANPTDVAMSMYLGDQGISANQLPVATRHYERVIQLQPKNALALNNLAWLAGQQGRGDAIALAERANAAAPDQPAFMDTLAMLLSAKGEHAKALELQKKVLALKPDAPVFKLNMAKIQIAAGDKTGARQNLDALSALGDKFAAQAEVKRQLQKLQ